MRLADITSPISSRGIEKNAGWVSGFKGLWNVARKVGGGIGKDVGFTAKATKGITHAATSTAKATAAGAKGAYHAATTPYRAFKKLKMTHYDPKTRTHKVPNAQFTGKNKAVKVDGVSGEYSKIKGKRTFVPKYETKNVTLADRTKHVIGKGGAAATHPLTLGLAGTAGVSEMMTQRQYPTGPTFLS